MPAPTFNLPVSGSAPNQYATEAGLEAAINTVLEGLWDDLSAYAPEAGATVERVPLITSGSNVLVWLDANGLQWAGKSAPVPDYGAPSSGASLHRWRMASQRVRAGVVGAKAKVALIGDSWMEMQPVPAAMAALLQADLGITGEGWRPGPATPGIGASSFTSTGWTVTDASVATSYPYGVGPDGHCCHTTGTTAQMTLSNVVATQAKIYHFRHGGTWRYRVDGGAWVSVTDNSSGTLGIISITGLSDAAHTIQIDTTGNTGTVAIAGIYTTRAATGAEVLRLGNGGITAERLGTIASYLTAPLADMQPDLAVVVIGTNDYQSYASLPDQYIAGLTAMVTAVRAAVADIGFAFYVPPLGSGTVVTPLTAYRDAIFDWAVAAGHEVISGLDRWPAYGVANAHGLWADPLHPSTLGAQVIARDIYQHYMR